MSAKKRLLVLTSATGAGHDTHAQATAAWCDQLYGADVEVRIDHTLEKSHVLYRGAVEFYNLIQRHAPWFHHIYYNIIELLETLNHGTVGFGQAYYIELLKEFRPDAILSVHDCLNLGYFELAKQVLGPVRCATYCVEFGGGYGFSRNWVNPRTDFFFPRTEETGREGRRRGLESNKVHLGGHWAPPAFYGPDLTAAEKTAELESMGLDPNTFTFLISTGGAGAQNHLSILKALLPLRGRLQVIVLCGRDPEVKKRVEAWASKNSGLTIKALSFTEEMPKLLRVVSAVAARAGATTAGESLLCGCPIIFNALGGMMPQETPTWRYFKARRIGQVAYRPAEIASVLHGWLGDPAEVLALRQRIGLAQNDATPEAALRYLLEG